MAHKFRPERAARLHAPERDVRQPWRSILDLLNLREITAVADIGAGTGYFALPLARALAGQGQVYALDIQPEMLALLRERQEGIENLQVIQTGEPALPLRDQSVDAVLLINMLHEFSDLRASLREVRRILRPGGMVIISDWKKIPTTEGPPLEARFTEEEARVACDGAGFDSVIFRHLYAEHFTLTGRRAEEILVDTDWLEGHLQDPNLRIVDIRGIIRPPDAPKPWYLPQADAYAQSHVPGAVFVDWTQDIIEPGAPYPMALASPSRFAALMEGLGIGDQHTVVAYDDTGHIAPRLWWALHYYGHPATRVLNGGWKRWVAEGRSVTAERPAYPPATFTVRIQPRWRASVEEVQKALASSSPALLDCRSGKEFRGEIGRGERKGRIPGAVNLPSVGLLEGPHHTWKAQDKLRCLFEGAGLKADQPVITYCNAGVSASVGLMGLRLAGFLETANFAGSWYEWERDLANPVEVG